MVWVTFKKPLVSKADHAKNSGGKSAAEFDFV